MPADAQSIPERAVDFVGVSAAITEQYADTLEKQAAMQKEADALIPDVVQALLANGRIDPGQEKEATAALKSHTRTLQILLKTAAHRTDAEGSDIAMGRPAPAVKQAGARSSLTNPYVGARRADPFDTESNRALLRGLGIASQ